jgi:hypothetical protein
MPDSGKSGKTMSFDAREFLASLTELPGVYRMLDTAGSVLYVGKAKNLKKRVASYFRENLASPRIAHMVSQIAASRNHRDAHRSRSAAARKQPDQVLSPRYNILFRDDKSYPYIVLTAEMLSRGSAFSAATRTARPLLRPLSVFVGGARQHSPAAEDVPPAHLREFGVRQSLAPLSALPDQALQRPLRRSHQPEDYAADVQLASMFLPGPAGGHRPPDQGDGGGVGAAGFRAGGHLPRPDPVPASGSGKAVRLQQQGRGCRYRRRSRASAGQLCVNLAMVRGGRHLGDRPLFPQQCRRLHAGRGAGAFLASIMPPTRHRRASWSIAAAGRREARRHRIDPGRTGRPAGALQRAPFECCRRPGSRWRAECPAGHSRPQSGDGPAGTPAGSTAGSPAIARTDFSASNASTSATPWAKPRSPPAWCITATGMKKANTGASTSGISPATTTPPCARR